jgi:hypothetical protein
MDRKPECQKAQTFLSELTAWRVASHAEISSSLRWSVMRGETGTRPGGKADKSGGFVIVGGAIGGYDLDVDGDMVSFQV